MAMLLDAAETFQKLVTSPPAHLLAGGVLAGLVWKCSERIEVVLTEDTKLQIAIWLLDVKPIGTRVEQWPDTCIRLFDVVFGSKHISLKCFSRSFAISFALSTVAWSYGITSMGIAGNLRHPSYLAHIAMGFVVTCAIPDYVSLLKTRFALMVMSSIKGRSIGVLVMLLEGLLTVIISMSGILLVTWLINTVLHHNPMGISDAWEMTYYYLSGIVYGALDLPTITMYAAFASSVWLWLYVGSGYLLKAARRLDIGFQWFNRHFDIEKKPLQAIGLVSGAFVALAYWLVVAGLWLAQQA